MRYARAVVLMGLAMLGGCTATDAATAPHMPATAGPKNESGLTAALTGKMTYTLAPGQTGKTFRDQLEATLKSGGQLPATPVVVFVLTLKNAGDKNVTMLVGGDQSWIDLKLEGPGAVTHRPNVMMTMEFRMGKPTALAPGQTTEIKIVSLSFGHRGISELAYWTEPGEYTLTATLNYTEGEKQEHVTSAPVKVKVETAHDTRAG